MTNELNFRRVDLLQTSAVKRNTLLVIRGKSKSPKILVGDESGSVVCFSYKKGEPVVRKEH